MNKRQKAHSALSLMAMFGIDPRPNRSSSLSTKQSSEDAKRQMSAAEAKRQRKQAKNLANLQRDPKTKLSAQPVYVPWNKAAKELGMEHVGIDFADGPEISAEFIPAHLENSDPKITEGVRKVIDQYGGVLKRLREE